MAQQTLSFSRNLFFTGLDADPNEPQPATLRWELDNDPTLAAASIDVRFAEVQTSKAPADGQGADDDTIVYFELRKAGTPTAWADFTQGERDAVLAVLAAHTGTPTRADTQSVVEVSETDDAGGSAYVDKLTITTEPLRAGRYKIVASGEHRLQSAPGTLGLQRSAAQIAVDFNDGNGEASRGNDFNVTQYPQSFSMVATFNAREGQTVSVKLQHRNFGAGAVSMIRRARLSVDPVEGTEG